MDLPSWEWASSLDFDWQFISGKKKFKWPLVSRSSPVPFHPTPQVSLVCITRSSTGPGDTACYSRSSECMSIQFYALLLPSADIRNPDQHRCLECKIVSRIYPPAVFSHLPNSDMRQTNRLPRAVHLQSGLWQRRHRLREHQPRHPDVSTICHHSPVCDASKP
jgi:hypothetical protein